MRLLDEQINDTGCGDRRQRTYKRIECILLCAVLFLVISFMPTWQDSARYQWGLHGYPEVMNTLFRDMWIKLRMVILLGLCVGTLYALGRAASQGIPAVRTIPIMAWFTTRLRRWMACFLVGFLLCSVRYLWNQPKGFRDDSFLVGYRERISQTVKLEDIRTWMMTQGYRLEALSESQNSEDLTLPPSILHMLRLNERQAPWATIRQQHLWIYIDGWDQMSFALVIGARTAKAPQTWRCLPFQEGAWVIVEDDEFEHPQAQNACMRKM